MILQKADKSGYIKTTSVLPPEIREHFLAIAIREERTISSQIVYELRRVKEQHDKQ